jgi:hypothetical protein
MRDDRVPGERRTSTDREDPSRRSKCGRPAMVTTGIGIRSDLRSNAGLRNFFGGGSEQNMEDDMLSDQRNIARRLFKVGEDR